MDCRELDNLLYPYLDGELVEDDRIAVESHLAACDGCRASTDRERATLLLIRSRAKAGSQGAPESLRSRLSEQLHDETRRRRMRQVSKLTAAAAGLAICSVAAHHGWRSYQRGLYQQDAVNRYARAFPLEVQKPTPEQIEAWFHGKLDHRVAAPTFPRALLQGVRLSNVRERQAAYIEYAAGENHRFGIFVYGDKPGDVDVSDPEVEASNGFNTVTWRDGDVVYTLVGDLDDDDIRQLLPPPPAGNAGRPTVQPVDYRH